MLISLVSHAGTGRKKKREKEEKKREKKERAHADVHLR